tara:strand:- start:238 stop:750 length:513 start_codon:yes stop_codon:yes gene_type:complete
MSRDKRELSSSSDSSDASPPSPKRARVEENPAPSPQNPRGISYNAVISQILQVNKNLATKLRISRALTTTATDRNRELIHFIGRFCAEIMRKIDNAETQAKLHQQRANFLESYLNSEHLTAELTRDSMDVLHEAHENMILAANSWDKTSEQLGDLSAMVAAALQNFGSRR